MLSVLLTQLAMLPVRLVMSLVVLISVFCILIYNFSFESGLAGLCCPASNGLMLGCCPHTVSH
jgi:hypothetical protein